MADKSDVVSFIRSSPETWVSAANIVSAVGNVPDRTLRNWLRELVEDGSIESRGERTGRRYLLRKRALDPGAAQLALEGQPPGKQRRELAALGKRDPIYGRAGTFIKKIYDRRLIDLAFNSARLEGNTYALLDTERLLLQGAADPASWTQGAS